MLNFFLSISRQGSYKLVESDGGVGGVGGQPHHHPRGRSGSRRHSGYLNSGAETEVETVVAGGGGGGAGSSTGTARRNRRRQRCTGTHLKRRNLAYLIIP